MRKFVRNSAILAALAPTTTFASAQTTITTTTETYQPGYFRPQERTTIYRTVTQERHVAPDIAVRTGPPVRYEVGAPVPQDVELYDFPEAAYIEYPPLRDYRYVYVNHRVVLVDPRTSQVVDVIAE
jgi:hypothetical protein